MMRCRLMVAVALGAITFQVVTSFHPNTARPVTWLAPSVCSKKRATLPSPLRYPLLSPATPPRQRRQGHALRYSRYDSLVLGVAEITLGACIGVLWSEYAVFTTGCGPLNLSDGLERFCYQAVIVAAGLVLFTGIVTQKDVATICQDIYGYLQDSTVIQVRAAELLLLLSVLGAFVALGSQMYNGQQMDGLTGIDVQMCRAIRDL